VKVLRAAVRAVKWFVNFMVEDLKEVPCAEPQAVLLVAARSETNSMQRRPASFRSEASCGTLNP